MYKFHDLVIQVVAPRTIGLNVQLTNAAGENVARCSFKTRRSYMNTNDAIDLLQRRFELLIFYRDDLNFTNPSAFRLTTPIVAAEDSSSSNRFQ